MEQGEARVLHSNKCLVYTICYTNFPPCISTNLALWTNGTTLLYSQCRQWLSIALGTLNLPGKCAPTASIRAETMPHFRVGM